MNKLILFQFFLFFIIPCAINAQIERSIAEDYIEKSNDSEKQPIRKASFRYGKGELPADLSIWSEATEFRFYGGSSLNIDNFPTRIFKLTQLKKLSLNAHELTIIPKEIGNLKTLERLFIFLHKNKEFPLEGVSELSNLSYIHYTGSGLRTLTPRIQQLKKLDTLILKTVYFLHLPPEIGALTNLRLLEVASQKLGNIPKEIGNLTKLEKLDLSGCIMDSIPKEIGNLTNLTFFRADGPIEYIPEEIKKLQKLEYFELGGPNYSQVQLPLEISQLVKLKTLVLPVSGNLTELLRKFENLTALERLSLHINERGDTIPKAIGQLPNLKELEIDLQNDDKFPAIEGPMENIQKLIIYGNHYKVITNLEGLRQFPNLTELEINSNNKGVENFQAISSLKKLKKLKLYNCNISSFPTEFFELKKLEELNLKSNKIKHVPLAINELTNLKVLKLGDYQWEARKELYDKVQFQIH